MNKIYIFIIGIVIGIIVTILFIFDKRITHRIDINLDKYYYSKDSIEYIINNQQHQIDSLNKVKSKIIVKYETLYNYMLTADNDSVVSYISKKIYSK